MQHSILRSFGWLGTAALALASIPAIAEPVKVAQATSADLGAMSVSLKDVVKLNYGIQGQLQGAGTPNEAGIGGFLPLRVGKQSVTFLDVLANVNLADYPGYSSIMNTTVAGGTVSTSTRIGQRWLDADRSSMYGLNFGYDSRPMATGPTTNGDNVGNSQTVFFQQLAFNAEAVHKEWSANAYWLLPIGKYGVGSSSTATLNDIFQTSSSSYEHCGITYTDTATSTSKGYSAGPLNTVGLKLGYSINNNLKAIIGYYYQVGDGDAVNNSGVSTKLEALIANGLTAGVSYSYDQSFNSVFTGGIKYRFGEAIATRYSAIDALTSTPTERNVRVHDVC